MKLYLAAAVFVVIGAKLAFVAPAVALPQQTPFVSEESVAGPDTYQSYCAPCHGRTGRGDGPVAAALKTRPPDLTMLAKRHGGKFPRAEVTTFVAGRGRKASAHGSGDMPVWGPAFRAQEALDSRISVRLLNVVDYLETLQVK
jgi:mono/diheme cytochrome c family protein